VSIEAVGPGGCRVRCHLRLWQRRVWFAGGEVSFAVPLVLIGSGRLARKSKAKLAKQLKRWGYRTVTEVARQE
jgi:hypothetical protein